MEKTGRPPSVLFMTYTNALTNYSRSLLWQLMRDTLSLKSHQLPATVRVTTVDKLAREIVGSSGRRFSMADKNTQNHALRYARDSLRPKAMGELDKLLCF